MSNDDVPDRRKGDRVPLREYVEALIDALRVQLMSILEEQRRGIVTAEQEREKAAQALVVSLAAQIEQGDAALREHITQQVHQINAALDAMHREMTLIHDASERAIAKAEELNKERWEGANKWRDQSSDRERTQQEEMAKLTSTFLRQDTADAKLESLRQNADTQFESVRLQVADLAAKVGKIV